MNTAFEGPLSEYQISVLTDVQGVLKNQYWLQYRPLLVSWMNLEKTVDELLITYNDDFCWAPEQTPRFVSDLIYQGFLPITTPGRPKAVLLPKLHLQRCVMQLENLVVTRSTRKAAKKYTMTVDTCFGSVVKECIRQHGMNWLGYIAKTLEVMNQKQEEQVQIHSVEVWSEGKLVAGEIGSVCGAIYTSMTGFCCQSGAGSVQLCALGRKLQSAGFKLWDLGMTMDYKLKLGAEEYPREKFVKTVREFRDSKHVLTCPQHTNARDVIDQKEDTADPKEPAAQPTSQEQAQEEVQAQPDTAAV